MLDPDEEIGPKVASYKKQDGTMVSKPLEDLAPFLPREEFKKNMIVKIIERLSKMLKILFLDFDGVLFDTVDEAYEVCIKTDFYINKTFSITSKTDFKKYRPYVGPAYGIIIM